MMLRSERAMSRMCEAGGSHTSCRVGRTRLPRQSSPCLVWIEPTGNDNQTEHAASQERRGDIERGLGMALSL